MRIKKRKRSTLLATLLLVCFFISSSYVEAGVNKPVLDANSLEDTSRWNNVEEDVVIDNGTLFFQKESTEYTRFISKTAAEKSDVFPEIATIEGNIKFTHFPAEKSFMIVFGLEDAESIAGTPGNIEVTFVNQQGIKVGVVAYGDDAEPITVCEPKSCGISLNRSAAIKAEITDDSVKVIVNGKTICTGTLPVVGEGMVGFMQTGECAAEVSNLKVQFAKYDRPQNSNIEEDFEAGSLNVAALVLRTINISGIFPEGNTIDDYSGNKVLFFKNCWVSYLGTRHTYSNFEISFDIPYLKTMDSYDEKTGEVSSHKTESFALAFGADTMQWTTNGYDAATETVMFEGSTVYSLKQKDTQIASHSYWKEDVPFSVKLSMVDGNVTVSMKKMNEATYHSVLNYTLGDETPVGYVQLWIPNRGSMAIDNLVIRNLDSNPNLLDIEFKSGALDVQDTKYIPFERVYADGEGNKQKDNQTEGWNLLIPSVATLGLIVVVTTLMVMKKKQQKNKEEITNEKTM